MTVLSRKVAIDDTTTATLIAFGPCTGTVYSVENAEVLLGGADVSHDNGFPILAGIPFGFRLATGDDLYAQCGYGSATVHVISYTIVEPSAF